MVDIGAPESWTSSVHSCRCATDAGGCRQSCLSSGRPAVEFVRHHPDSADQVSCSALLGGNPTAATTSWPWGRGMAGDDHRDLLPFRLLGFLCRPTRGLGRQARPRGVRVGRSLGHTAVCKSNAECTLESNHSGANSRAVHGLPTISLSVVSLSPVGSALIPFWMVHPWGH